MNPSSSRHSSLERSRIANGIGGSAEDIYRQRLDDAYYLRRMRDILMDGSQPRPVFPCRMTRLSECLYIGNQKNAEDIEQLMTHGITHVVNCAPSRRRASCSESPYPLESGIIGFKIIPAEDKEDYEIIRHFDDTVAYLDTVGKIKGRALVHCNMGVNRSGAIAAAFLMVGERRRLLEVVAFLKEKRNIVLTNKGFRRQLIRYAREKRLLDPISSDYYVRRSGDFERLPRDEQQLAFSTPQLRRCTVSEQKPPRSRHRNGRCRTSAPANRSDDRSEFTVRSLPRNIARSGCDINRGNLDRQWSDETTNPTTRRSISYIAKEPESPDDPDKRTRARSFHSSFRKSIAVDRIYTPTSDLGLESKDDIPRLNAQLRASGGHFSSRCNLTIGHPDDGVKPKSDPTPNLTPGNGREMFHHHHHDKPPSDDFSRPSNNRETGAGKSRYCKQIRQHFSGLFDLIRPNAFKSVLTSTQTSTPRSNQLSFAFPFQKSESKAIRIARTAPSDSGSGSGSGFYVSTNRIAMSAPGASFHGPAEWPVDGSPSRHFSTKVNHVVRSFNHEEARRTDASRPQAGGSLVLIGTRTLQPRSPAGFADESKPEVASQPTSMPGRLRRYARSKTDSELL